MGQRQNVQIGTMSDPQFKDACEDSGNGFLSSSNFGSGDLKAWTLGSWKLEVEECRVCTFLIWNFCVSIRKTVYRTI